MAFTGIRCTMIFAEDGTGFTETYSFNGVDFGVCKPAFVSLFKARANLCGPPVRAAEGRMTAVTNDKASRTYQLLDNISIQGIAVPAKNIQTPFKGAQLNTADRAQSCVQLTYEAGPAHHRNAYLAGVPDELIGMNPVLIPNHVSPTWQADFDAFAAQLLGPNPWGYDGRLKVGEGGGPVAANVLGLVNRLADGLLGVVYAPGGLALPPVSQACLRNFVMLNGAYKSPNGLWVVAETLVNDPVVGQNTTYLRNSEGVTAANVLNLGTIESVVKGFLRFSNVIIKAQANRKRGNRFLSTPGRRTTRHKI